MKKAKLYKKISKNMVQCTACKWKCKIANGRTGICGVRKNINGELNLLVHSRVASANIDPIEKKPLYHFLPGTEIFSIGTIGCNFGCAFCQNWDISQASKNVRESREAKALPGNELRFREFGYELSPKEIADYCLENKIPSIAFTYNEPAIFAEYARDVMDLVKPKGKIYGVFVSNGFETEEALDYLEGSIDAYNIDLKSFSEKFYQKVCKAKLKPVLEIIKSIYKRGKWLELTTLIIPGENGSDSELKKIAEFIASISPNIPWHVSAFHPVYKMQDKTPTKSEALFHACEIGKKAGLKFIYTGNILDNKYNDTFCPKCSTKLIERNGYQVRITALENGKCTKCGLKIPGVWK